MKSSRPIKKVEIIAASVEVKKIIKMLEDIEVSGYTLIRDVEGDGDRGRRLADELTDVFSNSYFIICCTEEKADLIADKVQPRLKKFGGACIVSDGVWVRHRAERKETDEP